MLASVEREEALRLLKTEHDAVRALIAELTAEEMTIPDTIRYGLYSDQECSFKDLLAHLICYEAYSLEAIEAWQNGKKHWVIDAMDDYRESVKIHYRGIEDRREMSLQEVLDEWQETHSSLEDIFSKMTDEQWRESAPYATSEPTDLGGMLEPILVAPPRPMYRHLPVHVPNPEAYIRSIRR